MRGPLQIEFQPIVIPAKSDMTAMSFHFRGKGDVKTWKTSPFHATLQSKISPLVILLLPHFTLIPIF